MPALLIPMGVILIAFFALSSYLTAVEQQKAQAPEIDVGGWRGAIRQWRYFIPAPIGLAAAGAKKLANAILSRYAAAKLGALAGWFTGLFLVVQQTDRELLGLSRSTADAIDYQTRVGTPRAIDKRVRPVNRRAKAAAAVAGAAAVGATRWGRDVSRDVDHSERVGQAARTKARTAARTADRAGAATRVNSRDITGIRRRVKALERPITAAAAAAVLALGMRKIGFRFWRCGAFRRVGRQLGCGHFAFLEALLAVSLPVLTVAAVCRFLPLADSIAGRVERVLRPVYFLTDNICEPAGMTLPSATVRGDPARTSWLPSGI